MHASRRMPHDREREILDFLAQGLVFSEQPLLQLHYVVH